MSLLRDEQALQKEERARLDAMWTEGTVDEDQLL